MFEKLSQLLEDATERFLFASRWLLAPFYVGLALALVVLLLKFVQEFWHLAAHSISATEAQVILGVLTLVDLALIGTLLVIVIFSGYENFVSRIDHSGHEDWPSWMGTIDFTALKLKLLSSIVAISAIELLKQFLTVKDRGGIDKLATDRELFWHVTIHMVFVISALLLALSDRVSAGAGHGNGAAPHTPPPNAPPAHAPQAQTSASHGETGAAPKQAGGQARGGQARKA